MLMELDIFSAGKEYISASRAAKKTGYAPDYIGQLCRSGKLPGKLIDRTWYVDLALLQAHKRSRELGRPKKLASLLPSSSQKRTSPFKVQELPVEIFPAKPFRNITLTYARDEAALLPMLEKKTFSIPTPTISRAFAVKSVAAAAFALVLATNAFLFTARTSPDSLAFAKTYGEKFAALIPHDHTPQLASLFSGFSSLHNLLFGTPTLPSPSTVFTSNVDIGTTPVVTEKALTQPAPSINPSSYTTDLKSELRAYIDSKLADLSTPTEPRQLVYAPTINTTVLRSDILSQDTRPVVTRQSTSDVENLASRISHLANGGAFENITISGGSIEAVAASLTTLTFDTATGTSATTTNFFATTASTTDLRANVGGDRGSRHDSGHLLHLRHHGRRCRPRLLRLREPRHHGFGRHT